VKARRLSAFIDAIVAGRRPGSFRADPDDAAVLRTAITLRAARASDDGPDEHFVSDLYTSLAEQMQTPVGPVAAPRWAHRGRLTLATVAAGLALVGGTAAVTEALSSPAVAPAAATVPHGGIVRTGTFETADGRIMGQIVVYRGHPSWVFMNVDGPTYDGSITCELQVEDGSTVAAGNFDLHGGVGQFSRTIQVNISRLRGAKLVTPTGAVVASATFV
jgi:hypothetical protein